MEPAKFMGSMNRLCTFLVQHARGEH